MKIKFVYILFTGLLATIISCSPSGQKSEPVNQEAGSGITLADSMSNKGVGPVTQIELGAIDATKAAQGKTIFDSKCTACHKFDVRYVGPALAGVTKRRTPEWIMNQMLNPDKMIKEDPLAKSLFEKYLTPMTFQNLTQDDARAILEYFRQNDLK